MWWGKLKHTRDKNKGDNADSSSADLLDDDAPDADLMNAQVILIDDGTWTLAARVP
eukprot:CAMPEP_0194065838 /NCGR_PEP_ID=MMETSP0009_2-20130614/85692_1 /TAXON_ID=210454 /ORGANISM="Grammatophora oceanica, Strain CCMP 410" /LENGTH=55 /DNA_ID=CAMNT_0038718729 /DNA_START=440 /DNA_END=607 /DNA_ORIENTATION=-